ncbi:type VII secretion-associated serine protease mycosin [Micromonospora endophytica]|uniref:Type VII secretion-associated serine protease mycosin n=1 Tax=Micromonospora endophytica TaxID=515350 RepID=A0A2W2CIW4_9ACTN|nr:type VII secretion-associated serine protease mycosin [Micromonospora endophytica]PZF91648.1 type VII secretion-associated serine protease mycosin [Micromonospora endophytica]RIW40291.1 type VII secretion-associated serine protease mycosin [Micromonospora endophytica]BCJ59707.1 type VII secretion-associated serine protease [Micromonospora endophytica]
MVRDRPLTALALVAAVLTGALVTPAPPAVHAAPGYCQSPSDPGEVNTETPWHQRWLAPQRVWPFSTGAGVRVAVIDSGTDGSHPQLTGRVTTGFDPLHGTFRGDVDCVSHGTAVASIIAARQRNGVGFHGLAPDATIVPIRVSERIAGEVDGEEVSATVFAQAIRQAVDDGADVINLSVTLYRQDPEVEAAVRYAVERDVVLVAAVGNQHREEGPDPVPYPAAYDGVIGVGAVDATGTRIAKSQVGPYVDIVAPGGAVVAATHVSGHAVYEGTSFATPMVSATAALIRSAEPRLSAKEVTRRLLATADPVPGNADQGYGRGVVNPYRAVTERLTSAAPVAQPPLPEVRYDAAAQERADRWAWFGRVALWIGLALAVLAAGVAALAALLPRGRRTRWRPTRPSAPPPAGSEIDEPEEIFFQVPTSMTRD